MAAKTGQLSEQLTANTPVHMEESNNNNGCLSNATHQLNYVKSETSSLSKNGKLPGSHLRDKESTITVRKHDIKLTYSECTEV